MKVAQLCLTLQPCGLYSPWNFPGQNTGVGSLSLLQGIFPIHGLNPALPHCRRILYQLSHRGKPKNTGVGSLSLLQGIFPTQGSNPALLHCRWILYQLSHMGSPIILDWVAYPFSSRSSPTQKSNRISFWVLPQTQESSCIAGGFFTH